MNPPTDAEMAPGEVARSLRRIEDGQSALRQEVRELGKTYVGRGEFEAWREGIGREIGDIKTAIGEVKTAVNRPSPLPKVATIVLSAIAVAVAVGGGVLTLIQTVTGG